MDFPLLQALKPYKESFNVKHFVSLPTDTPYGNLNLTYSEIVTQIECLNGLITELYTEYRQHDELVKIRGGWSNIDEGFKHKFQIEQVIYWLHKTADELIAIIYLLKYHEDIGSFPVKIEIASIGKLLNRKKDLNEKVDPI